MHLEKKECIIKTVIIPILIKTENTLFALMLKYKIESWNIKNWKKI